MDLEELHVLIKRFEGCRLTPYYCPAGVLTCGWGSTGPDVIPGVKWTQAQADARMQADALRFAQATQTLCPGLSGSALCAVADFAYNLGVNNLKNSTLRRKINQCDWEGAAVQLRRWVNGGGRRLPGLVLRREAEISLLMRGVNDQH